MRVSVDVSVVIPTHDRPDGLARLLAALSSQTIGPERFEVIVVDDGSRIPVTPSVDGLPVQVVRHEQARGPAAARNAGWRRARAGVVAFIDDDCAPVPGWLEAVLAAADSEQVVVQGPVAPMPDQVHGMHPLSHTIEIGGPNRLFVSANIAYPRALLERVGGFDERFTRACGEDVELGARAMGAGAVTRFAPAALVHHEVRERSLAAHLRHTMKWTDSVLALSMHPELRSLLRWGVFWKPTHPWLLAAAVALLARRPRIAALVLGPYFAHYVLLYKGHLPRLARALPSHLAIDVCEIATAIAGSARYRALML